MRGNLNLASAGFTNGNAMKHFRQIGHWSIMAVRIYTVRRFSVRTGVKAFEFHSFYFHKLFVRSPILFKLSNGLQIPDSVNN